jgi:hypothetical protein
MIFSRIILPIAALAVSTLGFVVRTPLGGPRSVTNGSTLNMVADDAKVILVTGSSRGLGKAIALELGKNGQKVVVNYVSDGSQDSAADTVKEIKALGGDAIAIQADSESRNCHDAKAYVRSRSKTLINNSIIFLCSFRP